MRSSPRARMASTVAGRMPATRPFQPAWATPTLRSPRSTTGAQSAVRTASVQPGVAVSARSEEHTAELQSLMRISYAVYCLKKKNFLANITLSLKYAQHHYSTHNTHEQSN